MRTRALVIVFVAVLALPGMTGAAAEPRAFGQDDGSARSGELTVLSYNVAGLPEPLSDSEPTVNSPLIGPLLNDFDLVLLQESWGDETGLLRSLHYYEQLVAKADHPHRSRAAANPLGLDLRRPGAILADGLNRLSRFPFGPIDRQMWTACHGELAVTVVETILDALELGDLPVLDQLDGGATDCAATKGFSMARTTLAPGLEVDVYNLHADAGSSALDRAARADNHRQLAAYIRRHSAGRAVILGGDTNTRIAREPSVWPGLLAATGLQDACGVVDCGSDDDEIDRIAFRSGGGVQLTALSHRFEREHFRRADGQPLSDHDAVAVRLRWTTDARADREGPSSAARPSAAPPAVPTRAEPQFVG